MNIESPPSDTITDIQVHNDLLYVSSFDKSVKVYRNGHLIQHITHSLPVLKMAFLNDQLVYSDISGTLVTRFTRIGTQCGGIQGLAAYRNSLVAAGWSRRLQIVQNDRVQQTIHVGEKTYAMALQDDLVLLGCSGRAYAFVDLRKSDRIVRRSVKSPVCSAALNGCAVVGTADGKIRVDFGMIGNDTSTSNTATSNTNTVGRSTGLVTSNTNTNINTNTITDFYTNTITDFYTFRAHSLLQGDTRVSYPVNSFVCGTTLVSAGSDGRIVEWNMRGRTVIKEIYKSDLSVSVIRAFGDKIVAGFSYNYERGAVEGFPPELKVLNR